MKVFVVAARSFIENQTYDRLCETWVFEDKEKAEKKFREIKIGFIDWLREGDMNYRQADETPTRTVVWEWPYVFQVTLDEVEVK